MLFIERLRFSINNRSSSRGANLTQIFNYDFRKVIFFYTFRYCQTYNNLCLLAVTGNISLIAYYVYSIVYIVSRKFNVFFLLFFTTDSDSLRLYRFYDILVFSFFFGIYIYRICMFYTAFYTISSFNPFNLYLTIRGYKFCTFATNTWISFVQLDVSKSAWVAFLQKIYLSSCVCPKKMLKRVNFVKKKNLKEVKINDPKINRIILLSTLKVR